MSDLPPLKDWNDAFVNGLNALEMADALWVGGKNGADANASSGEQGSIVGHTWDEPDLSILDDRRGDLPEFPLNVLSLETRQWLERAARGAGVTPAHVAVPLIGITSGLMGTMRRVMASRSWTQPMTVWSAMVGFSGTGKTPGIDVTKRALAQIERDGRSKIAELARAHQARVETAKAARSAWKKEIAEIRKKAVVCLTEYRDAASSEPAMPPEAVEPEPFIPPRLFVSNATIERLAVLLQARPQGMLLIADELAGLFLNMARYSGGQDNEFWLEAWNSGSYSVERMGRPPLILDHLLVGMVGGLQPDKLSQSFQRSCDGMYARILFAWPAEPAFQPLSNDVAEIEPELVNALGRLINLTSGSDEQNGFAPIAVPLSLDATAAFEDFRRLVNDNRRKTDGREREWWAKAPANALRIAGTLSFLAWAWAGGEEPKQIEGESMRAALKLICDYFWPHSQAALRQIGLNERHTHARRVLRWLVAEHKESVSREEVRRYALGKSLDADASQKVIDSLVRAGWLRRQIKKTAGRSALRWSVNPRLASMLGEAERSERSGSGQVD